MNQETEGFTLHSADGTTLAWRECLLDALAEQRRLKGVSQTIRRMSDGAPIATWPRKRAPLEETGDAVVMRVAS